MFSTAYKRYALATLTSVYTLNLVDRGVMAVLLQSIKEDLQLTDTQLGFVMGIAFALFYATAGVPIARWADRGNRVTITSLAIGLWAVTVMACLFVGSYLHLVFARIAAAVGESGCKPPTYSLVGDYFPAAAERTRAMSIYLAAGPLAALSSFLLAGWLNELYGWRLTFFLLGLPGLGLALLVKFTIVEPRSQLAQTRAHRRESLPVRAVLATLWRQQSCRHLSIALILLFTLSQGLNPWYAAVMVRSHGMSTAEIGVWLGLIFGIGGVSGMLLGGYVVSRWFTGNERGQMRLSAVSIASVVPFYMAFLMLPDKYPALLALIPLVLVTTSFLAPVYALMQRLVADEMRATALAVVMLLANMIGMGIGPQAVGILSDALEPALGTDSLRYAMLAMSFVALWTGAHLWKVGRTVQEDLLEMAQGGTAGESRLPFDIVPRLPSARCE